MKEYLNDRTELTFEHLNSFPYVGAFIKESLRLHTPIPFLSRTSVADFTIGKYHIPKGSRVLFPEYYLNKDENTFDEATKFVPDRFLEQCKYQSIDLSFIPRYYSISNQPYLHISTQLVWKLYQLKKVLPSYSSSFIIYQDWWIERASQLVFPQVASLQDQSSEIGIRTI